MRRVRMNMDPNAFDRERKPPGLPKRVPPPKLPKRGGPSGRPGPAVLTRNVYEAVAPSSTGSLRRPYVRERVRDDREVIYNWLRQILFHEYTDCFLEAGYDLPSIARMTPADLAAIGIRPPSHRRFLKQHIDALVLPDALPRHVPATIEKWLRLVRLEEYLPALLAQGFRTVPDVTVLTWDDLEEVGIVRLGHQKRLLLAIERIKDVISGRLGVSTVSEEVAEPQPIEHVTIECRSVASVTHELPPSDGPYNACISFRSSPAPEGAYALLTDLGGPKTKETTSSIAEEAASSHTEEAACAYVEEAACSFVEEAASSNAEEPKWSITDEAPSSNAEEPKSSHTDEAPSSHTEEPKLSNADEAASSNAAEPKSVNAEEEQPVLGSGAEQGAAAVTAPTPEVVYNSSVLDDIDLMLAGLMAELDALYDQQMDGDD